jgi:ferredoxin
LTIIELMPYLSAVGFALLILVLLKIRTMSSDQEGWWTRSIVEGRRVKVEVEHDLCMGSATCTELAPGIFHLDWGKKKSIFDPAPLELTEDTTARAEDIFRAAQSCPYRAIILQDQETMERLFPL